MIDPNEPAFPCPATFRPDGSIWMDANEGIPIRLHLAAQALPAAARLASVTGHYNKAVMADVDAGHYQDTKHFHSVVAAHALCLADALIAQANRTGGKS